MQQEIISAGIDIGTTTSQVIFSRLTLEDHSYTAVPDVKIAKVPSISRRCARMAASTSRLYPACSPMNTAGRSLRAKR